MKLKIKLTKFIGIILGGILCFGQNQIIACEGEQQIIETRYTADWVYTEMKEVNTNIDTLWKVDKNGNNGRVIATGKDLEWCLGEQYILYSIGMRDEVRLDGMPYIANELFLYSLLEDTNKKMIAEGTSIPWNQATMPNLQVIPLAKYKDNVYFEIRGYLYDSDIVCNQISVLSLKSGKIKALHTGAGQITQYMQRDDKLYWKCTDAAIWNLNQVGMIDLTQQQVKLLYEEEIQRYQELTDKSYKTEMYDGTGQRYEITIGSKKGPIILADFEDGIGWAGASQGDKLSAENTQVYYRLEGDNLENTCIIGGENEPQLNFSRNLIKVYSTLNPEIGDLLVIGEPMSSNWVRPYCYSFKDGRLKAIPFMVNGVEDEWIITQDAYNLFFRQVDSDTFETTLLNQLEGYEFYTWRFDPKLHAFHLEGREIRK